MELKTFDTILTGLCDSFDELITPRTISRTNTNIIYLIFKAIAKGFEVINNVCITLSNKFDPASCTDEDLDSVAKIVGTERFAGSGSGLSITVTNSGESLATLLAGEYNYALDDDTTFTFEVFEDTAISSGSYVNYMAVTETIGSFPVTAQSSITVTSTRTISSSLVFSCADNSSLLGTSEETDLEFRKRILEGYDNQDSIVELENQLRNLPYLFDCRIKFNNTVNSETFDGYTIPPFTALIFYSGSPRTDMATVIANKIICPTVQTEDSVALDYVSSVFVDGKHTFYVNPFGEYEFEVEVVYKIDEFYISNYNAQTSMQNKLVEYYSTLVHRDYILEDDIYNILSELDLAGVDILGVNLKVDGSYVNYVEIPTSRIPKLVTPVIFTREGE